MHEMQSRKSVPAGSTIDGPVRFSLSFLYMSIFVSNFQVARRATQPRQEDCPKYWRLFIKPLEPADARALAHRLSQDHEQRQ
jgi:hypothetical protein